MYDPNYCYDMEDVAKYYATKHNGLTRMLKRAIEKDHVGSDHVLLNLQVAKDILDIMEGIEAENNRIFEWRKNESR